MKKSVLLLTLALQFLIFQVHADTVVAIHGFMASWRSMKPVRNALQPYGYDVCLWHYPSRKKLIQEHACDLVAQLRRIACKCPGQPIHFVTHSVGALILRSALNMAECPIEARMGRAVMIAPTNQGSYLARRMRNVLPVALAMGPYTGWQLTHYDPCQIKCFGELPDSMQALVIAGTSGNRMWFCVPNDGFLAVEETYLDTPSYFASFGVSHGELLTTPSVLRMLRDFIICGPCVAQ